MNTTLQWANTLDTVRMIFLTTGSNYYLILWQEMLREGPPKA